ncbi:MAG: HpcH/HpaI aldolase/citrate lyase family protein [Bosea sp. (in: a-proteobacteria)]
MAAIAPLFVPASRPERFAKAAASGADMVILDLEDAVAPVDKVAARNALDCAFTDLPVLVRINASGTPWHADDLAAVRSCGADGIVLPKAEHDAALTDVCVFARDAGLQVVALIETARGLADVREIGSTPGVVRLAFGSLDFCVDIGATHTRDGLLSARCALVLASRLAGICSPIDGVTVTLEDEAAVESDARHAASLGFGGKLCIHPNQIAAAMAGFKPTQAELAWARKIVASGDGAAAVDGMMVDAPVRRRAEQIVRLAEQDRNVP